MSPKKQTKTKAADGGGMRKAAEDAIGILKKDPERMRALLRSAAQLVDEAVALLVEAGHEKAAGRVRFVSTSIKGAALLPASLSAGLALKLLEKAMRGKE